MAADFRWDCGEDLVCLPPADDLSQIADLLKSSAAEYALIVSADQIYHMDYRKLLRSHVASRANMSSPMKGIYVFNRNVILRNPELRLEDYASEACGVAGYCRTVETLDDYYAANMDLLNGRIAFEPYCDKKMLQFSRFASNSRVALGARLNRCSISGSIISGGVRVESAAIIEDSVILPGSHIGPGAEVRQAIVSENAVVAAGARVGGDATRITVFATEADTDRSVPQIRRRCARVATKSGLVGVR